MSDFEPIRFGKYQLIEKVAQGGMAEVYKAKSYGVAGFEKLVCIKKILPHLSKNGEFVKMFINEAKIAVSLNHANIVQVYDLGKVSDEYYMGMEFIHGQDLMTIIKLGRKTRRFLPIPTGVYIITELCRGLDYAHNLSDPSGRPLNIVHQDVSPHNLMISYEGDVKLMDFGIASFDAGDDAAEEKVGGGKFAYMAPEQANGMGVDRRSDIFAAGIILYEVITGQRLYAGKDRREKMRMVRNAEIPPPRAVNPEIPVRLEEILLRALARDPDDRYSEARDMQEDLLSFLYDVGMRVSRQDLAEFQKDMFAEEYRRANAGSVVNAIFNDLQDLEHQGADVEVVVEDEHPANATGEWDFVEGGSGDTSSGDLSIGASLTQGERRQVEVLAIEITGLTDIADRVGEEGLLRLSYSLLKSMATLIQRYQGEILSRDSDRLLVFWGFNKSTSKDLELCLRCASDLRRLSEKFAEAKSEQIQLSMGVHRGPVLAGAPGKRKKRTRSYTPWGDTVKQARRLCEAAGPDEVLVSEKVYSLIAEHGQCEMLDPVPVKWATGRVTPYRLQRLRGRGERATGGRWVKRGDEFEVLKAIIGRVAAGEAAVLSLEGEAGSGKARFVREIRELTRDRDINFYAGRGYYYRREVPFLPFREVLEQICGFEEGDDEAVRREKLQRLSELRLDPIDIHVIGKLYDLEFEGSNLKYLSGDQIRLSTFEAIRKIFAGMTSERFVILALENHEYIDHYSRELASHLVRTLPDRRLLLVLTQPKGGELDLPSEVPVERLEMPPMAREELATFCSELLGVAELPAELLDRVAESSGGNALFAKEIIAQLRRQGLVRIQAGKVLLEGDLGLVEIPPTVEDLIGSRIDALASTERVVLEVAATMGRAFEKAVLAEVTKLDHEELAEILARLQALKLLRPVREDEQLGESDYVFRNNLCWEVTTRGILSGRSKEYHVRVGEALERLKADQLRAFYEILSRHYQAGGLLARASRFAEQAGQAYEKAYYSREAQRCYQRAILLLRGSDQDADSAQVSSHLAELYLRVGAIEARHLQNDEAIRSFSKALDFAGEAEDDRLTAQAMIELARLLAERGDTQRTGHYLRQAQELAQTIGDELLLVDADEEMAKFALESGDFAMAKVALNRALGAARAQSDRVRIARILGALGSYYTRASQYGLAERHLIQSRDLANETDDKILQGQTLNNLGVNYIHMERFRDALDCYRQACEIRKGIEHRRGVIINLHNIGDVYFRMGDYARAFHYFQESLQAAKENGWERGEAMNYVFLGYLQALQGEAEGEQTLEDGIGAAIALGDGDTAAQGKVFLARVLTRRGDMDRAREVLTEASTLGKAVMAGVPAP